MRWNLALAALFSVLITHASTQEALELNDNSEFLGPRALEPRSPPFKNESVTKSNHKLHASKSTRESSPAPMLSVVNLAAGDAPNHIENTGSAAPGATASITADTAKGQCHLNNDLSQNQQASWTGSVVSTCCTSAEYSECWYRIQAKADPKEACFIPRCEALQSNEPDKMAGFRPMSGSNGKGKYQNIFPILLLSSAMRLGAPALLFLVAPLGISLILLM